jgi:hypothetical protein
VNQVRNEAVYEVKGTERKEVTRRSVPCGECVTTSYYDPNSGELLRRDIEIQVDSLSLGAQTGEK